MNRSWTNIIKVLYAVVLVLVMFAGAGVANVAYVRNRCVNIDSSYTNFGDGLVRGEPAPRMRPGSRTSGQSVGLG